MTFGCGSGSEGQFSRDEANTRNAIEESKEMDTDIGAERFLKRDTILPPLGAVILVDVVGKWDLSDVACWQEPNCMYHPSQAASSVCSSREAKYAYLVALFIRMHQEIVGVPDMKPKEAPDSHIKSSCNAGTESMITVCTNSSLVVRVLIFVVLFETAHQVHNIAIVMVKFIASSI